MGMWSEPFQKSWFFTKNKCRLEDDIQAEFNTDLYLSKIIIESVCVFFIVRGFSGVTLVVTIQMQSIVPSRE